MCLQIFFKPRVTQVGSVFEVPQVLYRAFVAGPINSSGPGPGLGPRGLYLENKGVLGEKLGDGPRPGRAKIEMDLIQN